MAGPDQRLGVAYRCVAAVVRPLLMIISRRSWEGTERIPPVGTGVVVVGNHVSHLDPFTLAHVLWDNGRATRFLAKEGLFRIPVIGRIIAGCGQIPVYRESRDAARAYRDAVKAIREGECVAIYPEGTITKDPDLWPMIGKTGAARVALETGCEVLPMAQWGVNEILPPYAKRLRVFPRKVARARIGAPVPLEDLRQQPVTTEVMREATARIMSAITDELAELRGEPAPVTPFNLRAARPEPGGTESDAAGPSSLGTSDQGSGEHGSGGAGSGDAGAGESDAGGPGESGR